MEVICMWGNRRVKLFAPTHVIVGKARSKLLSIVQLPSLWPWLQAAPNVELMDIAKPYLISKKKSNHLTFYGMLITHQKPLCKMLSCFHLLHACLSRDVYTWVREGPCPHGAYIWGVCMCVCVCTRTHTCACWQRVREGGEWKNNKSK